MLKRLVLITLLLVSGLSLGPDDYVCLTYDKIEHCLSSGTMAAQVVYGDLQLDGSFTQSSASMQYTLDVTSLTDDYALVSVLSGSNIGIKDPQVDGQPTGLVRQGDLFYIPVKGKGNHQITLNAILGTRSSGITETAQFQLPLNISYTKIQMQIPQDNSLDIQPHLTQEKIGNTVIAQLGPSSTVTLTLTKIPAYTPESKEPKIYADTNTLATVGEATLSVSSSINYNVLHTGVNLLEVQLPKDAQVVDVRGPTDWKVVDIEGGKKVQFVYDSARTGQFTVYITYEKSFSSPSFSTDVPELIVLGVERERGYVGVMAQTAIEVTELSAQGLTRIDPTELPSNIWTSAVRPIVFAYKYLTHPWSLSIEAAKHEELPVLIAAVDRADVLSLMSGNHMLTKYTMYVKNNRKQYLELKLPAGSEVWSTFVNGQPVKPVQDEDKIKIPLIKSQGTDTLYSFPVEVVYITPSQTFWVWYRALSTPTIDLPISQLEVNIYLPEKEVPWLLYTDLDVGSLSQYYQNTMPFLSGGLAPQVMRSNVMAEDAAVQVEEMVVAAKEKGVLPVEVEVPRQGNLIQLKKVLAVSDSPSSIFIIQLNAILSLIIVLILPYFLITWTQNRILESIKAGKVDKKVIIKAALLAIVFLWVLWDLDWMVWITIIFGILGAATNLIIQMIKPNILRKFTKKKRRK